MRVVFAMLSMCGASVGFADEVRLTNMFSDVIVGGDGIVCSSPDPATTFETSYWNSYTLSRFGIVSDLRVREIEFGVELLELPTLDEATIIVNFYLDEPFAQPTAGLPLLATTTIALQPMALEVVSVDIDALVPPNAALIVEVVAPTLYAGFPTGDIFLPGSNRFGSLASTYLSSAACGRAEPEESCGFDGCFAMVLTVIGETLCEADVDGDGELTVFDFLAFQNLFATGDPRADFDGDGVLTVFDFLAFQNGFTLGC